MLQLTSSTETVSTVFSNDQFFQIPDYQRPFSWSEDEFDDLVKDLRDADRNQQYFLGTIVLHRDNDTLIVVDGQQRLTSLLILLACLRDRIADVEYKTDIQEKIVQKERKMDGIPQRNRLEVRDAAMFNKIVIAKGGTLSKENPADFAEPERRYLVAIKTFHERLASLSENDLQGLAKHISQRCVLIKLTASDFNQAFRLFEVVNDRGKQLRRVDILKSKNIDPVVVPQEAARSSIANRWHELENEIGEDDFESVFFLIRLLLVKDKPQGDLLREFEDRVFKTNIVKKGEDFAALVFDYVRLYRAIFVDADYLEPTDNNANKFQSLLFIMNSEFAASEWKSCVLYFANKFGRDHLYEFICAIEKLFLTHWVAGVRKDERYDAYTSLLKQIDAQADPSTVIASIKFDEAAVQNAAMRTDMYSAGFCKYFLLRLELTAADHDAPRKFSAKSIEHVFPQKPKADSDWAKKPEFGKLDEFVNMLGNLVLISKSRNSSAGNSDFAKKKDKYLSPRVSSYPRSVLVLQQADWSRKIIEERTQEAAKLLTAPI